MRSETEGVTTASELAQSCVCEQQIVFDHTHGKNRTRGQQVVARAGSDAHGNMHSQAKQAYRGVETSQPDKRCFIASAVFGPDSLETWALRDFRDRRLMTFSLGRHLVEIYYLISPPVANYLSSHPRMAAITGVLLKNSLRLHDRHTHMR